MKLLRPLAALTIAVATMLLLASCLSLRGDIALDRQAHASGKVSVEITSKSPALLASPAPTNSATR